MKRIVSFFIIFSIISSCSSEYDKATFEKDLVPGRICRITRAVDLQNDTIKIPEGVTLRFSKNGMLLNGTLEGCMTQLEYCGKAVFENVNFTGSWNVPLISSSMIVNKPGMLKSLFALANDDVKNTIIVEDGDYYVYADSLRDNCLTVRSKNDLIINGNIFLLPNNFTWCNILLINGCDITVSGKGSIVGDRKDHYGEGGEWGMGIRVRESENVLISDITVKDCWGDCIYVGEQSDNVYIRNCELSGSRRQGISITSVGRAEISDCTISNIQGTDPEFAIDVEPNRADTIGFVRINNVRAIDCEGGFKCWKHIDDGSLIKEVEISRCSVEGHVSKEPYSWTRAEKITMIECVAPANSTDPVFDDVAERIVK